MVVEKPFCPSSTECDGLIALAKDKGKILTVFQNRRWDADFVTLKRILAENQLGRVVEFESHFDRYDPVVPPRDLVDSPGSGVIYDLGTHLFDQILDIYGPPTGVTGFLGRQRERSDSGGPFDACSVLLHYGSGLLATVKASPMTCDEVQLRFWVRGSKGSYKKVSWNTLNQRSGCSPCAIPTQRNVILIFPKYHFDPQEPQLVSGIKPGDPSFGVEQTTQAGRPANEFIPPRARGANPSLGVLTVEQDGKLQASTLENDPPPTYGAFYTILLGALEGKNPVPVDAREARNVIRLVELARESSETGKTISIDSNQFLKT